MRRKDKVLFERVEEIVLLIVELMEKIVVRCVFSKYLIKTFGNSRQTFKIMKKYNSKINFYTPGQRFAARVLFIVWLCVSYSLEGALAVRRDGTKVSANTVALGSFGRLANIASGAAIWALLSVPVSSLDLLEYPGECLAGDEQLCPYTEGLRSLQSEDCTPSFFTGSWSYDSEALQNLWDEIKIFKGCSIVVDFDECGLVQGVANLEEKATKLNEIRSNLYNCLEDHRPVYIKNADMSNAYIDNASYTVGIGTGAKYTSFYNLDPVPDNLRHIDCSQQRGSCVFIAGSRQPS